MGKHSKHGKSFFREHREGTLVGVVLVISLAALTAMVCFPQEKAIVQARTKSVQNTETAEAGVLTPLQDPRFIQKDVGWSGKNKVFEEGLEGDTTAETTQDLLKKVGHSAAALAVHASGAGLWKDPNLVEPLLTPDKKNLSQRGIELWYSLKGALTAKGTKAEFGNAPANGYNSGVSSSGKYGRSARPGIRGNRRAIIYTFRDGSKLIILKRCGNIVYLIAVKLPQVPTDNPPERCPANCDRSIAEQPVQENKSGQTPGVERGEPDRTKVNQDVNAGNPEPVEGGKTGRDDGPTTTAPDGTKESPPSYPVDPAEPPPDNEVPDGGTLPIVD